MRAAVGRGAQLVISPNAPARATRGDIPLHAQLAHMAWSYDVDRTWDTKNLHVLSDASNMESLNMGYPIAVETRPGEIFCVYYFRPTPEHNPQYDQIDPMKHGILSMRITLEQPCDSQQ